MEYTVVNNPELRLITMQGAFTFGDKSAFRSILKSLEESPPTFVVIDFDLVTFIDSAALGMLLLLREEQRKHNNRIVLRNARGQVQKMFGLSKFDSLFTVEG